MVEKLLIKMIFAALLFGVFGLAVAYVIFGRNAGKYIDPRTIFSIGGAMLENADPAHLEIETLRYKILAGGLAGLLVGGFVPVMSNMRRRNSAPPYPSGNSK